MHDASALMGGKRPDEDGSASLKGSRRSSRPFPELTDREFDVLEAMTRGLDTEAIAVRLGLNVKTVRNNVSNVLVKLHARDRAAAVLLARERGIGAAPD